MKGAAAIDDVSDVVPLILCIPEVVVFIFRGLAAYCVRIDVTDMLAMIALGLESNLCPLKNK